MKKVIIGVLACAPSLAYSITQYYDTHGYMQGFSVTHGPHTMYYDDHGYLTGTRIDTPPASPEPTPAYRPSMTLEPSFKPLVPSSPGVGLEMIGDPE